ncbi:MAG: Rpn family recombination-promoting nuclease/putative transposase [Planctomycetaceae bacterium]
MTAFHPNSPHDHFFRRTFDVAEHAHALIGHRLPAQLLNRIRPGSLQRAKETFLSADEHEKRLDLLYSAQLDDDTQVLIYLLFEHKSYIDRAIALQLLEYVLKIQRWRQRNKLNPCVVVPLLIYHGDAVWDEPTSLRDKVQTTDDLRSFLPDMQVVFVDLGAMSASAFAKVPELEARIRTLQLVRRTELAFQSVVEIFRPLRLWREIHSQKEAVDDIIFYLFEVFDAQKLEWFRQAIRTGLLIESENQMPTCLEAMMERGAEKGREEGRLEGRQEGRQEGVVIGRIRTLQQIFRQPVTPEADLVLLTNDALQALLRKLEKQLDGPLVS